ncbi:SRPBCC family protein [Emticicia sp. 21SJ11W-3]|uniref:SRPBCC family protein n=1 Tax=Emticicia sp. 21SJ11W-3 TaxID=2916755 RepID=UPI00209EF314|nr:SRPBCC family protein [Emticicia sp. 21SJ11W-3]UTA67324.1 SRPBCC family protein [Emticicia sp. 21SJ11W-3]
MLEKLLPEDNRKRKWIAIVITVLIAGLLTLWGIYGMKQYGIALFILTPLFIGFCSSLLYGINKEITKSAAIRIGLNTLSAFVLGLLIFAMEGVVCIIMVAPIAIVMTMAGSLIAYTMTKKNSGHATATIILLIGIIPLTAFVESKQEPDLTHVVTSIEIKADPKTVWRNVVEFPKLAEPTEFIFKTGIAYPINAKIKGTGVGAIRHCNFTTGSFVEPITVWDEPRLLKFDVAEQPVPMKEISFWDIDAPHLHDYFVSKQGQFKLTALPNGNTLLEGTTWYYHNIKPAFYWEIWSEYIVHKIHERVLIHIKQNAEREGKI